MFLSARVVEVGEVLVVPTEVRRRVIATQPQLSDKILAAFMARRAALFDWSRSCDPGGGFSVLARVTSDSRVLGPDPHSPHEWLDADSDLQVAKLLAELKVVPSELPVVISSGMLLRRPSPGVLADHLGLTVGTLLSAVLIW